MFTKSSLVVAAVLLLSAQAQFTCTFSGARDADSCTAVTDDSSEHCVWCSVGGGGSVDLTAFGFCVTEAQAEAMETSVPNVHCDRYQGNDDDQAPTDDETANDDQAPATDDAAPATDDAAPAADDDAAPADDDTKPSDDDLPDNYWSCLLEKTEADCSKSGCTWCDSKAGFGLCMTGPSAESAAESAWFTCKTKVDHNIASEILKNPLDASCVRAFMDDPTVEGCVSIMDESGTPCEWCSFAGGLTNLCLTQEQAQQGSALGVMCVTAETTVHVHTIPQDPYDPSCMLAFLQDQSEDACVAAVDSDGEPCEFCTLQGALQMCLNAEQAEMGEALGIECETTNTESRVQDLKDPYDPSCMLAYLQDQSQDACVAASDSDGQPCEFCTLQGALQMCLNADQAETGESLGIECEKSIAEVKSIALEDPYDPSCMLAFLQDQSEDACIAAVDSDGNPCEFCTLQGALQMCLNAEQAEMGQALGIDCSKAEDEKIELPPDFFSCLENYREGDCRVGGCTWCNTQVGMGFCLAPTAAKATQDCTFFDCELEGKNEVFAWIDDALMYDDMDDDFYDQEHDIYDPICLTAGMQATEDDAPTVCSATTASDGSPCVWCDAAGVFGLCLSSDQAHAADQFLQCNTASLLTATE